MLVVVKEVVDMVRERVYGEGDRGSMVSCRGITRTPLSDHPAHSAISEAAVIGPLSHRVTIQLEVSDLANSRASPRRLPRMCNAAVEMTIAAFHYALHRHLKLRDQEKLVRELGTYRPIPRHRSHATGHRIYWLRLKPQVAHILNGHIPEGNLTLGTVYGTNRVLLIHYL
jgi:hypothetical protein